MENISKNNEENLVNGNIAIIAADFEYFLI